MSFSKILVDSQIKTNFPDARIGWMVADLTVQEIHPYAEELKKTLASVLAQRGITEENLTSHPDIARWREVFRSMGVKPNKYKSTVEALVKRVLKGQNMWNISSVVDVYNCVTVLTFLALGAFDTAYLDGDVVLRYAKEGETFLPLGSEEEVIPTDPRQIVYADNAKIISWLWCYRDTRLTGVTLKTKEALFIMDTAFTLETMSVEDGMAILSEHLKKIGCTIKDSGIVGE